MAGALGLHRSHVGRIQRLAMLAPAIVDAIVEGQEPSRISLKRLVKATSMVWVEQRRELGLETESATSN